MLSNQKRNITLGALLLFFVGYGQTTLWTESFETDGSNGVRYQVSSNFFDGPNDHFERTDGANISNVTAPYSGCVGSYFWAAEDTDDNGGDGLDEKVIVFNNISTVGYDSLEISGLFAAGNANAPGSSNYDASDYLKVFHSFDGGLSWENSIWFSYENHGDASNEPIGLDTDFDGQSDVLGADRLNPVFSTFANRIFNQTDSITIKIEVHAESNSEELAFDELKVVGISPTTGSTNSVTATVQGLNIPLVCTFDSAASGFYQGVFDGSGVGHQTGQLASATFRFTGFSDGSTQYDSSYVQGDWSRGVSFGSDTVGGIYAFLDTAAVPSNRFMGLRAGIDEMNPGIIHFRIQNGTDTLVRHAILKLKIRVRNDQDSDLTLRFSFSIDGSTYKPIRNGHFQTPSFHDHQAHWHTTEKTLRFNTELPKSENLHFRIRITRSNSNGLTDAIGLDDIELTFLGRPVCPCDY